MAKERIVLVKRDKKWEEIPFTQLKKGDKFKIVHNGKKYAIDDLEVYLAISDVWYDEIKNPWVDIDL
jgi:hypothetical protein